MKQAIGIFDSGVGGLTVFKAIRQAFPQQDLIYFGDTARVPYGPKSPNTIIEYSVQNARFLLQQGIKTLIVACNTSSSVAIPDLSKLSNIPIIGVIDPGSEIAVRSTENKKIGVIGTEGTIRSKAYSKAIKSLEPNAQVFSLACPLFVPIVEEGWQDHPIALRIVQEYLKPMKDNDIDTLVLGCTHYPLLSHVIQEYLGEKVKLVDSANAIGEYLKKLMPAEHDAKPGKDSYFVSDNEDKFATIASRILGADLSTLKRVRLYESWFVE
ncbi:MAG: glutamate racemase [Candidatus Cloacimonadaceae bacterium]|jgi:glutamate racemase|nr:glutamate racemase [Candidatus Cloacimonadota bacterium]MDY0126842.1 glutamate racemase [Candidatus Cloacimonadaceae bacterium]MCB5255084.1 glutamate racemase [Candidatus Cloacimonadota bacterium]MCK9177617.1 glutamate racemase [Candidatus Cloacimonadota bacterium]MCK9241629.1 glutamate racemase [Candidatus Cloacimonadota bacterium]